MNKKKNKTKIYLSKENIGNIFIHLKQAEMLQIITHFIQKERGGRIHNKYININTLVLPVLRCNQTG